MGKAGRKRKTGVKRTASGQISRAKRPALDEHRQGILLRMRRYGLSEADARDQRAGSVVGRMRLKGEIGEDAYLAAVELKLLYEDFKRAVLAPGALREGEGGGGDRVSPAYEDWCEATVEAYEAAKRLINDLAGRHRGRNLHAAIDYLLLRDEDHPHLHRDLEIVLAGIAPSFGLTDSGAAAA